MQITQIDDNRRKRIRVANYFMIKLTSQKCPKLKVKISFLPNDFRTLNTVKSLLRAAL